MDIVDQANEVFLKHFVARASFERAVFYSWACCLEECCKYCYMSTLPKSKRTNERVRSIASILAETIIIKCAGWDYGFLSGGVGVFSDEKICELLKLTNQIVGDKVWINAGVLNRNQLEIFKPFIKGVVGTIEILDEKLHKKICPSKPIEPVREMFRTANLMGIDCAMTLIVGLGETINDFQLLKDFIEQNKIIKIHIYGLNPQKGTEFENTEGPSAEYQAEWISRTRIAFPRLNIQCGIWKDRVDRVCLLLQAGANSVSKYPAIKLFGSESAREIERQAKLAGRLFKGSLIKLELDPYEELERLDIAFKEGVKKKLAEYLEYGK